MIYHLLNLLYSWDQDLGLLRLGRYVTSRTIFAFLTAFLLTLFFGRRIIYALYRHGIRDTVRDYGVISVEDKRGTPTMGGVMIVATSMLGVLLWCDLTSRYIQLLLLASVWFTCLGAFDDLQKIRHRNSDMGLTRAAKYALQGGYGLLFGALFLHPMTSPVPPGLADQLYVPFLKDPVMSLSWGYLIVIVMMIIYASNAVNFADGLDGLAIVPTIFVLLVYGIFAYVLGNAIWSRYLLFEHMPGAEEMVIFCGAVGGAAVGFLWWNAYPAEVFMGDTGSIFLGGVVGTLIVLTKQEILFFLAGGIFTAEIASVMIQDWIGIQRVGKRFMYRAPIHHTFQYQGWSEPKIATRFWIIAALLAVLSLATLKVR